MQFPRHVYRLPGTRKKRGLPLHDRALCEDAAAYAKAKAAGWSDSYAEAIAAHEAKQKAPAAPPKKQPDLAPAGEKA